MDLDSVIVVETDVEAEVQDFHAGGIPESVLAYVAAVAVVAAFLDRIPLGSR